MLCFYRVWLVGGVGLTQSSSLLKSTPFREHIKDGTVALGMNFILHSPKLLKIDERSQDWLDRPNAVACLFFKIFYSAGSSLLCEGYSLWWLLAAERRLEARGLW